MLSSPAANTAAAAEAPTGTATLKPSTVTETVGRSGSDRGRNIEPPGREEIERRVERARSDARRQEIAVRRGEGHAAVPIRGESARKAHRLVIYPHPVRWHHSQGGPGAD